MVISIRGYISLFIGLLYLISVVSAQVDEMSKDGYAPGDQSYNISVALDHIFISKKDNSIYIAEIVVFRNEGEEIYYSKDNHTFFAISTPPDIKNLKTQAMECCLVQDEGVVYMDPMQSITPGANFDMQISYVLIPQDQEYVFNKSAIYNTTSISMFIDKKSGIDMEGPSEVITLSGNKYNVIAFNNLRAGEMISIPVKIIPDYPGNLYTGIGLFFLVSIGLIYFLDTTRTSTMVFSHPYPQGRPSGIFPDRNQMLSCIRAHKNNRSPLYVLICTPLYFHLPAFHKLGLCAYLSYILLLFLLYLYFTFDVK